MFVFLVRVNSELQYDERVKKTLKVITELRGKVSMLLLDKFNLAHNYTFESTSIFSLRLISRLLFTRGGFLYVKLLELNIRTLLFLFRTRPSEIWMCDFDFLLAVWIYKKLRYKSTKVIWDQHELPPDSLLLSRLYKATYKFCSSVLHANHSRMNYVNKKIGMSKGQVLHNYPEKIFYADKVYSDHRYIVNMGAGLEHRYIENLIEAVMKVRKWRLIIAGSVSKSLMSLWREKYDRFDDFCIVTGWIKNSDSDHFLAMSEISFIGYKPIDMNHVLCAPNRLYYSLNAGLHVLSSKNLSTLREFKGDKRVSFFDEEVCGERIEALLLKLWYTTPTSVVKSPYLWEKNVVIDAINKE